MAFINTVVARAAASIWGLKLGNATTQAVLTEINAGKSLSSIINAAFNDSYGSASNAVVAAAVTNNLGFTGDLATAVKSFFESQLATVASNVRGSTIASIVDIFSTLTADATLGAAATAFNAKVEGAAAYSGTAGTADAALIGAPSGTAFNLTLGQDNITATPGADTFAAFIFDNSNTWQSGDYLNGGAGTDTLNAELGSSANFAILPKTVSVENVYIRAQSTDNNGTSSDNDVNVGDYPALSTDDITVDADSMAGVRQLWSTNSRADLLIEDVRVNSHETTLGFQSADPSDVDYAVLFSPKNITAPTGDTSGATVKVDLVDVLGLAENSNPFRDLKFTGITLTIGTQNVTLAVDVSAAGTYATLVSRINAELVAKGFSTVTASLLPEAGAQFPITVVSSGVTYNAGTPAGNYNPILLSNSGPEAVTVFDYVRASNFSPSGAIVTSQTPNPASLVPSLTQVNWVLDDVGRGSKSGDVLAGSMSTGQSGSPGIQQFNVNVDRDSWIKTLQSTNNTLEVVNLKNIGANGKVRISNTDIDFTPGAKYNVYNDPAVFGDGQVGAAGLASIGGYGLTDVRVMDASTMTGAVTATANLTNAVVAKYLNLKDTAENPAADNSELPYRNVTDIEFSYDLGTGNDTLVLAIDDDNLEAAGTTTREDFKLTINGGAGDDTITLAILQDATQTNNPALAVAGANDTDGSARIGTMTYNNWYDNSTINANLEIIAGAGKDTVWTPGAGNKVVSLGIGDDTAYVDNAGQKGAYVFNARTNATTYSTNVTDLQSDANNNYKIYGGTLTLSYAGFEVTVPLVHTKGVVTDLQVNQTLKNAINNNAFMQKLLEAKDGPANTLVVRSLIDGTRVSSDLTITLKAPTLTDLTPARINQINSDYKNATALSAAQLIADMETQITTFVGKADYASTIATGTPAGSSSAYTADNRVDGGTGTDVIVLGTGQFSNDTVVYTGTGNGTDWIVNFDDTWVAAGTTTYSGAAAVAERIRVTFSNSDGDPAAQIITFDGVNSVLSAPATQGVIPAADVAYQFVQDFLGNGTDWAIVTAGADAFVPGRNVVTLERVVAGDVADATAAAFTGTYFSQGNGSVVVATTVQGKDAIVVGTNSTFTLTFDVDGTAADAAGSFVFNGTTVNYAEGDGAVTLAAKVKAATFADWNVGTIVYAGASVSLAFTAKAPGATAIATNGDFDLGTNIIVGTIVGTVGNANTGTPIATPVPAGRGDGYDILDFSAYRASAVVVDGTAFKGSTPTTGVYIKMTESTTNKGAYTIELVDLGATSAATDDKAAVLIGVADFGETQVFHDPNFII